MRLLVCTLILLSSSVVSLAQQGDNIFVGSNVIFNFKNGILKIDTIPSNNKAFGDRHTWKSFSNCRGDYIGNTIAGLHKKNDSLLGYENHNFIDEYGLVCGVTALGRRYSFPSITEPNSIHTILFNVISPDSIYFSYGSWIVRNDSIVWTKILCNGPSDTINYIAKTTLVNGHEIISNKSKTWYIETFTNNVLAFEVNDNGIQKYKRSTKNGIAQSHWHALHAQSSVRASNTGEQLAIVEDDGANAFNLYDFDKSTGAISYSKPLLTKSQLPSYYGCSGYYEPIVDGIAFSQDDSLIYVGYTYSPVCNDSKKQVRIIYQIKRFHPNPPSTAKVVFSKYYTDKTGSNDKATSMFTGPGGVIYWSYGEDSAIHTITNGNIYDGAHHHYNKFVIPGNRNNIGVSTSPSTYKRAGFEVFAGCRDSTLSVFYGSANLKQVTYYWGDGDSTVYDTGTIANGYQSLHAYDSSGEYIISQKALYNNCGYSQLLSDTVAVTIPPHSLQWKIQADTLCTEHKIVISDTVSHTRLVAVHWGDGGSDTLHLSGSSKTSISLSHTYTREDTFDISYTLEGHGVPSHNKPGCEYTLDSAYVAPQHPSPMAQYSVLRRSDTLSLTTDGTYTFCTRDIVNITQLSDSLPYFIVKENISLDTSVNRAVSYSFSTSGVHRLKLQAISAHGCSTYDTIRLKAIARPTAEWIGDTTMCQNSTSSIYIRLDSTDILDSLISDQGTKSLNDSLTYNLNALSASSDTLYAVSHTSIGCIDTFSQQIIVYSTPIISLSGDTTICVGSSSEYTPLLVSEDSLQLLWYSDNIIKNTTMILSAPDHGGFTHSFPISGTYAISALARSIYGCEDSASIDVEVFENPSLSSPASSFSYCINEQPIDISIETIPAGDYRLTTLWDDGQIDTSLFANDITAIDHVHTYSFSGSYNVKTVIKTSMNDCTDSIVYSVNINNKPLAKMVASDICEGDSSWINLVWSSDSSLASASLQANSILLKRWDSPTLNGTTSYRHIPRKGALDYRYIVENKKGCKDSSVASIRIVDRPQAAFVSTYSRAEGTTVTYRFDDHSSYHTSAKIDFGQRLITNLSPNFMEEYTFSDTGKYKVMLIVSNENICYDTSYQMVLAYPFIDFFIPTAISPNNDELNNTLNFNTSFIKFIHISFYNRWGQKTLQINNINELEKTELLPHGVYIAAYSIIDIFGKQHFINQTLTVLK